jgi:uncharacterized peroxidase-related enzyme
MQRINPIQADSADAATRELLKSVATKMGNVPNLIATMAHSVPVTNAYLGFSQSLSRGSLSSRLREKISLAVGQANDCEYCVAAHTAVGLRLGMSESETRAARLTQAEDEKERAALVFSQAIVNQKGSMSDEDFAQVREAGYTDGEVVEIVANVAINIFTNYFNHIARTEVDFPEVQKLTTA